jgi:hypothetical protein
MNSGRRTRVSREANRCVLDEVGVRRCSLSAATQASEQRSKLHQHQHRHRLTPCFLIDG